MIGSGKEIPETDGIAEVPDEVGAGTMASTRFRLPGSGSNGAALLTTEMFCLDFHNRRGLGGRDDLDSAPRSSGAVSHEQGFPKSQEGRPPLHTFRDLHAVHPCCGLHSWPAH